ncbi:MAG: SRPBCC family protein [Marmoricola sp.]
MSGATSTRADRELRAQTVVAAPPEAVWSDLSDLRRLPARSPELVRMFPLLPGGLRVGQQYLGINRRKLVVWPSRNVIAVLDPGRELAWDTRTSGARWIFELSAQDAGTLVVQRRSVPRRLTLVGRLFGRFFLGGGEGHADELEAGMVATLERLKAAVEG